MNQPARQIEPYDVFIEEGFIDSELTGQCSLIDILKAVDLTKEEDAYISQAIWFKSGTDRKLENILAQKVDDYITLRLAVLRVRT